MKNPPSDPFVGTVEPGWFQLRGRNWLNGAELVWPRRRWGRDWLTRCRAHGPAQVWIWDGRADEPVTRLTDLSRVAFDDLARTVWGHLPREARLERWVPLLRELVQSPLIDDEDKIRFLVSPEGRRLGDDLATSLPTALHAPLREAFGLERLWLDLDREPDAALRKMADVLAEPELVAAWNEARRAGLQARREEAQRVQREEEALRAALTLGRRGSETGPMEVTGEFKAAFRALKEGASLLFVTGRPGTGKSTFIRALRAEWRHRNLAVTSLTGAAALNVEGQTLHSFFQLPPALLTPGTLQAPGFKLKAKLRAVEMLVIDEVSMVRPDLIDAVDERLRSCRNDSRPFGGVKVVLVGDLYQLPPIVGRDNDAEAQWLAATYPRGRWFHAARVFDRLRPLKLELTKVFRQTQTEFLDFLGAVRRASLSAEALDAMNQRILSQAPFTPLDFHTLVVPHNKDVALHNQTRLERLAGEATTYAARVTGEEGKDGETRYPADRELVLKPSAQIMFLRNDPEGRWVNGDFGIVDRLEPERLTVTSPTGRHSVTRSSWDLGKYDLDPATGLLTLQKTGTFEQFPVRLSWALTIHKMQGQTVDRLRLDLGAGAFEPGMTYVALSRVRTLEGLRLTRALVPADLTVDQTVGPWLASLTAVN